MKNITISIPFYNNLKFFEDVIRIPLFDDRVNEIIVVDDCSDEHEYNGLLNYVEELLNGKEISFDPNYQFKLNDRDLLDRLTLVDVSEQAKKIKIYRNEKNLKGYRNKYESVKKATNEWVYLLDSDNFLIESSINSLYNIEEWNSFHIYCPSVLIMNRNDSNIRQWDDWNHRRFGYEPLDLNAIKNHLRLADQWQRPGGTGIEGFLNTGNYFFNRDVFLNSLQDSVLDDNIEPHAADGIAQVYYWLKKSLEHKLQIIPDLYYVHRLHDSSWTYTSSCIKTIEQSNYYRRKLLNA
jgi:glycosyltransferase involved in cell wall biosynthesis